MKVTLHINKLKHIRKNVIVKALGDNSTVEPDISKIKVNDFEKNKFLFALMVFLI